MVDKAFVVSTDHDGLKALIGRLKANAPTAVLDRFEPPIDKDAARFLLLAVKPQVYGEVLSPLLIQLLPDSTVLPIVSDVMIEVSRLVRDLRFQAELNGTWLENRIMLSLNPDV